MSDEMREALEDVVRAAERAERVEAQRAYMDAVKQACPCLRHLGGVFLDQVSFLAATYVEELDETFDDAMTFITACSEGSVALAANDPEPASE